ncbi:hypothetical protein A1OE_606 [Candidatus Endolissoclinum faulkneri L2]|uniref:Uncharacterized protein n=1 Tax=Candidatus Endolissoclinum faulkneri L2 TaxID=1193729 RepID=K7ZCQ1_9PROT|nr:hypothetical protein A1OE_606 [Candidatus Endolissoclinum faulkneri L2]
MRINEQQTDINHLHILITIAITLLAVIILRQEQSYDCSCLSRPH